MTVSWLGFIINDDRHPASLACPAKMAYPHLKVEEEGKMKVLPQKLTGSRRMVALTPKQEEEVASTKVTGTAAAKKVIALHVVLWQPKHAAAALCWWACDDGCLWMCNTQAAAAMIIIDSDDDSEGRGSCVILKSSGSGSYIYVRYARDRAGIAYWDLGGVP